MSEINQTKSTRNQSTIEVSGSCCPFIFDNRFDTSNIAGVADVKTGMLVARKANGDVELATASNLSKVIGVAKESFSVATGSTASITYGVSGTIDETGLILPEGVTLKTAVVEGGALLRDHLNSLGMHLEHVVDLSK